MSDVEVFTFKSESTSKSTSIPIVHMYVSSVFDSRGRSPRSNPAFVVTYEEESHDQSENKEMLQWESRLSSMESLVAGWDGDDAPAPTRKAIEVARSIVRALVRSRLNPKKVNPSVVGGVGVTRKTKSKKIYIEIYNDGTAYSLFSDGVADPETKEVATNEEGLRHLVGDIRGYLGN